MFNFGSLQKYVYIYIVHCIFYFLCFLVLKQTFWVTCKFILELPLYSKIQNNSTQNLKIIIIIQVVHILNARWPNPRLWLHWWLLGCPSNIVLNRFLKTLPSHQVSIHDSNPEIKILRVAFFTVPFESPVNFIIHYAVFSRGKSFYL